MEQLEFEYDDSEDEVEDEVVEFNFEDLDENSDLDIVKDGIMEKYGFLPSDRYVEDLILFVRQLIRGS